MYQADQSRYTVLPYRRCGSSGLLLPAVSLGLWHNFGDTAPYENMRALCRTAFDHGITHFDLANNYGPPYGSAELTLGKAIYAAPFCTFAPFAKPFLVPSGNKPSASPFFNAVRFIFIASISLIPLFTGITSNTCANQFRNLL